MYAAGATIPPGAGTLPLFNVSTYGVRGNGTDETSAWQTAMANIPGPCIVIGPGGTSLISGSGIPLVNGCRYMLSGTVLEANPSSVPTQILGVASITPTSDIWVEGLTVDAQYEATGFFVAGLSSDTSADSLGVHFEHCTFRNTGTPVADPNQPITFGCNNSSISHCLFLNLGKTIVNNLQTVNPFGFNMSDNWLYTNNATVSTFFEVQCSDNNALYCNNTHYGLTILQLFMSAGTNVLYEGNNFVNFQGATQKVQCSVQQFGSRIVNNACYGITFNTGTEVFNLAELGESMSGNIVTNCDFTVTSGFGVVPFYVAGANLGSVVGNVFLNNTGATTAMQCQNTAGLTVTGNVLIAPTGQTLFQGIYLSNCSDASITGNTIQNFPIGMNLGTTGVTTNTLIAANNFLDISGPCISGNGVGITINGGNRFYGGGTLAGSSAIELASGTNGFDISGNAFEGGTWPNGAITTNTCSNGTIGPNRLSGASGASADAITIDSASTGILIQGNSLYGTFTTIVNNAGAAVQKNGNYAWSGSVWSAA